MTFISKQLLHFIQITTASLTYELLEVYNEMKQEVIFYSMTFLTQRYNLLRLTIYTSCSCCATDVCVYIFYTPLLAANTFKKNCNNLAKNPKKPNRPVSSSPDGLGVGKSRGVIRGANVLRYGSL